jgi:hypothetical protein
MYKSIYKKAKIKKKYTSNSIYKVKSIQKKIKTKALKNAVFAANTIRILSNRLLPLSFVKIKVLYPLSCIFSQKYIFWIKMFAIIVPFFILLFIDSFFMAFLCLSINTFLCAAIFSMIVPSNNVYEQIKSTKKSITKDRKESNVVASIFSLTISFAMCIILHKNSDLLHNALLTFR